MSGERWARSSFIDMALYPSAEVAESESVSVPAFADPKTSREAATMRLVLSKVLMRFIRDLTATPFGRIRWRGARSSCQTNRLVPPALAELLPVRLPP